MGHLSAGLWWLYQPGHRCLHVFTLTGQVECLKADISVARKPKQVAELEQIGWHERDSEMEQAVATRHRRLQVLQGFGTDGAFPGLAGFVRRAKLIQRSIHLSFNLKKT